MLTTFLFSDKASEERGRGTERERERERETRDRHKARRHPRREKKSQPSFFRVLCAANTSAPTTAVRYKTVQCVTEAQREKETPRKRDREESDPQVTFSFSAAFALFLSLLLAHTLSQGTYTRQTHDAEEAAEGLRQRCSLSPRQWRRTHTR